MRKNTMSAGRAVLAALSAALLLGGCSGLPVGGGDTYLKDINPAKYVTLGDYVGMTINVASPNLDDAVVESYAQSMLQSLAGAPVTDRAAELGDTVNIDYKGKLVSTGEYFQGGTAQGASLLLGSGKFIPGYEDGVVGMTIGETKVLSLTFPENYGKAELAGQDAEFEVTLNGITAQNDDAVKALQITGVETVDAYINYLKQEYIDRVMQQYQSNIESALRDQVMANAVFKTPPKGMVERMKANYNEQLQILADAYTQAYGQSFTVSEILSYAMVNEGFEGDEDSYVEANAIDSVDSYLAMAAIAAEQGITVSDDEARAVMEENLSQTSYDTIADYLAAVDFEEIKEQVLYDKVMDYLIANNTIEEG